MLTKKVLQRKRARRQVARQSRVDTVVPRILHQDRHQLEWVKTVGTFRSSGATNTIITTIKTNTLLHAFGDGTPQMQVKATNLLRNFSAYRVHRYRIKLSFYSRSATVSYIVALFESPSSDYAPATGTSMISQGVIVNQFSQVKQLASQANTPSVGAMACSRDLITLVGRSDFLTDSDYAGSSNTSGVATDPANLTYAYLAFGPYSGTATANESPAFLIELMQFVEYYDPRT